MNYFPSFRMLLSFMLLLIIVGGIIVIVLQDPEDIDVLGAASDSPQTTQERFIGIVRNATNKAAIEVRNQTENLLVEQATQVVVGHFDNLSNEKQDIIRTQVCGIPEQIESTE